MHLLCDAEGQSWNSRFKGVPHPLFGGNRVIDLASASQDQTSDGTSISTPTTMSDQGSVGTTTSYFTRNFARTESEVLEKTSCRTEGQARNSWFKGVRHPLFEGNGPPRILDRACPLPSNNGCRTPLNWEFCACSSVRQLVSPKPRILFLRNSS